MPLGTTPAETQRSNMPMGQAKLPSFKGVSKQIKKYKAIKDAQNKQREQAAERAQAQHKDRTEARANKDQAIQEHMGQASPEMDWGTMQEVQERQRRKEANRTSLGPQIGVRPSDEAPKPVIRDPKTGRMQPNAAYQRFKKNESEFPRIQQEQANIQSIGIHTTPMTVDKIRPTTSTSKYHTKPGEGLSEDHSESATNAFSSNLSAAQARTQLHKSGPVPTGATPFPGDVKKPTLADGLKADPFSFVHSTNTSHRSLGLGHEVLPANHKGNLE
jgi:hypothetical protein